MSRRARIMSIFFLVGLTGLTAMYYWWLPAWIQQKIDALSLRQHDKWKIDVEKVRCAWPPGSFQLYDIGLHHMASDTSKPDTISIGKIRLQGFGILSFLFQKKYSVDKIRIYDVAGSWTLHADADSTKAFLSPADVCCDALELYDMHIIISKTGTPQHTTLQNKFIAVENFSLSKDAPLSRTAFHFCEIQTPFLQHVTADSMYTFSAHQLKYSSKEKLLRIDSFHMLPNYDRYEFASRHDFQTDRIEAALRGIAITQFHLDSLILLESLLASTITVDSFYLDVFRDRRHPFLHKTRPLYQDLLKLYPGIISIDSVAAQHGTIYFSEHDENAPDAGAIWFTDVQTKIKNIYNDSTEYTSGDSLIVSASARAMGKGDISFVSSGSLSDAKNTFHFSGKMENISVDAFNPMLRPNASLLATDGYVHGIYFNFYADHTFAGGDLIFRYNDLRLAVVDKETGETGGIKNNIMTMALNRKLLNHNPMPNGSLREGVIYFERNPEKMFFSYMLKSIFSGIRTSVDRKR